MVATAGDIVASARKILNAKGVSTGEYDDADLWDSIDDAQRLLCKIAEISEGVDVTINTVAGTRSYTPVTSIIRIRQFSVNGNPCRVIDPPTFQLVAGGKGIDNTSTGQPQYVMLWQDKLWFEPIPDAVYNVRLFTILMPTTIASGSTPLVSDEYNDVILARVLYYAFAQGRNTEEQALSRQWLGEWKDGLRRAIGDQKEKKYEAGSGRIKTADEHYAGFDGGYPYYLISGGY